MSQWYNARHGKVNSIISIERLERVSTIEIAIAG